MIDVAFAVLAAAALFGVGLAILYARGASAKPLHYAVPAAHGIIGAGGLGLLIGALRHGGIGAAAARMGEAGFGATAAGLIGLALMFGLGIAVVSWRGKRPGGALIGIHASLAIAGIALLLAVVAVI
jgi:hypothetical protein